MKSSILISLLRQLHDASSTDNLIVWATTDLAAKFGTDFSVWTGFDAQGKIRNACLGKHVDTGLWKYGPAVQKNLPADHAPLRHYQTQRLSLLTARLTDFGSQREFEETALCKEAYRHMGSRVQLSIFFGDGRSELNTLSFGRNGTNYTDEQLSAMTEISYHLQMAYERLARIEKLEKEKCRRDAIHFRCINSKGSWYYVFSSEAAVTFINEQFGRAAEKFALPDRLAAYIDRALANPQLGLSISSHTSDFEMTLQKETECEFSVTLAPTLQIKQALGRLTSREAEVLTWISKGKKNDEIGKILGICRSTVGKHVENIFRKLDCETRTAAAAAAMDIGRCS